jgi:Zn-dependent M28 family amino/carboxypeptidase
VTRRAAAILSALALLVTSATVALGAAALALPRAGDLQHAVDVLAGPDHAGRRSGTEEGVRAARLIARWLADAGLQPGGDDGSFLQTFVLESELTPAPHSRLHVAGHAGEIPLGIAWMPHGGARAGEVVGPLAFVGHGIASADGWDDYAGVDARGAVAIALEGGPPHRPDVQASRLEKLILARQRGAAALLIVGPTLASPRATGSPVALASGAVTTAGADALLAAAGHSVDALARQIAATGAPASFRSTLPVRLRIEFAATDVTAHNVVGILPGTDPALAHEAVLIGAHHDHVGMVGGAVHPGADDNASGTAVAVGLARAFAAAGGTPRTLVFALFGAEELGLVGSGHYVGRPAWPLERTVAMLNFDMVGRMRQDRLMVGGVDSGAGLGALVAGAARAAGVRAELRPSPFAPSDHSRFYTAGTPVLFFFTGLHEDYHRPGDTADKINASGMARVAEVAARVVLDLAAGAPPVYVKLDPPRGRGGVALGARAAPVVLGVSADARRGWDGVPLSHVVPGSAAARAGLRDGDVLVRLGGTPLNSFDDLRAALSRARPGEVVRIVYLRGGVDHAVTATLDAHL